MRRRAAGDRDRGRASTIASTAMSGTAILRLWTLESRPSRPALTTACARLAPTASSWRRRRSPSHRDGARVRPPRRRRRTGAAARLSESRCQPAAPAPPQRRCRVAVRVTVPSRRRRHDSPDAGDGRPWRCSVPRRSSYGVRCPASPPPAAAPGAASGLGRTATDGIQRIVCHAVWDRARAIVTAVLIS